jgi:hypothetical protein
MAVVTLFLVACGGKSESPGGGAEPKSDAGGDESKSGGDGEARDTGAGQPDGSTDGGRASEGGTVGCPQSAPMSGDACSADENDGGTGQCEYPGGMCNSSSSGGSVEVYFSCSCVNGSWECGGWGC